MKALFLESRAARQIREWADKERQPDHRLEEVLEAAYNNGQVYFKYKQNVGYAGLKGITYDEWWVDMCLKGDLHKDVDINFLMEWIKTPEGQDFWSAVNRNRGRG